MNGPNVTDPCPNCHAPRLRSWGQLTDEERMIAVRMHGANKYRIEERKKHRFCTRCWFEDDTSSIEERA